MVDDNPMTDKFIDKLRLIANKRGYEIYYPCATTEDTDDGLGVGYSEPQYDKAGGDLIEDNRTLLLVITTINTTLIEAVIKALPKVKNA